MGSIRWSLVGVTLFALMAVATRSDAQFNTVHACVNKSSGQVQIVAPGTVCKNNETLQTWKSAPTGGIAGQLTLCPGDAGSLAGVLVHVPGRNYNVFTGDDGKFQIDQMPQGIYGLSIESGGAVFASITEIRVGSTLVQLGDVTLGSCEAPDQDHDGVPDSIDNCPTTFNPDQLDTDHNGVGDVCESHGACTFSITPTAVLMNTYVPVSAGTSVCVVKAKTATVTVSAGCTWSAVADPGTGLSGWLEITSGAGPSVGTGGAVTLTYMTGSNAHAISARTGVIRILDAAGNPTSATLMVSQAGDPMHRCP